MSLDYLAQEIGGSIPLIRGIGGNSVEPVFAAFAVDLGSAIFHGANWKMVGKFSCDSRKLGLFDNFGGCTWKFAYS